MSRRPLVRFHVAATLIALGTSVASPLLAAPPVPGAPPAPAPAAPAAPPGPAFANRDLGLSLAGPSGWKLLPQAGSIPQWQTLATFVEQPLPNRPAVPAGRQALCVLSLRRASAVSLGRLRAEVTKAYADDKSFTVTSITDLPPSGRRPLAGVLVDATQVRAADPAPAPTPGAAPAPTSVTWRVLAAYFLGGEYEYLLYTQAPATLYASLQPSIAAMIDGVTLTRAGTPSARKGEGSFRDESAGFACQYPPAYGVRLPERTLHLVEFTPATAGPVLGVYRVDSALDLDAEAKALVDYYTGSEVGGEATASPMELAGRAAALVTAKGRPPGFLKDSIFLIAVVKRGNDTFRLRATGDLTDEPNTRAAFDRFAKSFVLSNSATVPASPEVKDGDAEKPKEPEDAPQ